MPLKTLPWKPLSSLCLLTIVVDRSPCLVPGNKHCTFLHHSLVSIDDFAVRQASRPKLGWMTDNYISAQREEGRWTREPGLEEQHGDEFSGFSFCLRGACSGYWEILMCLACCDSWGCKESDTTERLNWTSPTQTRNVVIDNPWGLSSSFLHSTFTQESVSPTYTQKSPRDIPQKLSVFFLCMHKKVYLGYIIYEDLMLHILLAILWPK